MIYRYVILLFAVLTVLDSTEARACGKNISEDGAASCGGEASIDVSEYDRVCEQGGYTDEMFMVSTLNQSCHAGSPDNGVHASVDAVEYDGACVCNQLNSQYTDSILSSFEDEEVCELVGSDQKTTGG